MTVAIKVENLSKKYLINHEIKSERYETFSDTLIQGSKSIAKKIIHPFSGKQVDSQTQEEFWALKDINFEINQGDKVGIIGRNGAGKSTLLKTLSRITEPTSGKIHINGRIASLLEVGTGFHPELTGRENIYLNGAILGMRRVEIKRKFDEIVAFSEVEKFLDTPVKRYSSGMYVRLAFAVAAHLESEILIVDEVLAVGDVKFQKKCLGKMEEIGKEGRTVLFVSHNMGVISQLCPTCIWLEQGTVLDIGKTERVSNAYILDGSSGLSGEAVFPDDLEKSAQLKRICLVNQDGEVVQKFSCDESVNIKFEVIIHSKTSDLHGYIGIDKPDGTNVLVTDSFDALKENPLDNLSVGMHSFVVTVPARTLAPGEYMIHFALGSRATNEYIVDCPGIVCGFSLDDFTSSRGNNRRGYFSMLLPWQIIDM